MKVIIAGGRHFDDYGLMCDRLSHFFSRKLPTEIISGCATGADALGERWAAENSVPVVRFPADWQKYGKAAGPIRNKLMAEYAGYLIVFWDGRSTGTRNMIDQGKAHGLETRIVVYF